MYISLEVYKHVNHYYVPVVGLQRQGVRWQGLARAHSLSRFFESHHCAVLGETGSYLNDLNSN